MKKVLAILFTVIAVQKMAVAQCPPGASALYTHWIFQSDINTFDTLCFYTASHFPAVSKVYFYDINSTLVDSLLTDATGYGHVNRSSTNCLFYIPNGVTYGTAVSGSCTTNLNFVELLPIHLKFFTVTTADNKATIIWQPEEENPGTVYNVQESSNGTNFSTIYTISNTNSSTPGQQYQYKPAQVLTGKRFYRLKMTERSGATTYSPVKTAMPKGYSAIDIYPTIGNGSFTVSIPENFIKGEIKIFSTTGSMIQNNRIITPVSKFVINSGKGLYYVKAIAPDGSILVKTILLQ